MWGIRDFSFFNLKKKEWTKEYLKEWTSLKYQIHKFLRCQSTSTSSQLGINFKNISLNIE